MSVLKMIYEICFIVMGLLLVIIAIEGSIAGYYALLGLGAIGWGAYDFWKEIRDRRKKGEVSELTKEREEIQNKLNKED